MTNDNIYDQQKSFEERNSEAISRTLQLFRAGSGLYGVFADEIATVGSWRKPTPLPHSPASVLGIVSLQGRMMTVLDIALLLADADASSEATPTESESSAVPAQYLVALRGDEQVALAIEEVGTTIEIDEKELEKPETAGQLIAGVARHEGLTIPILNPEALFPQRSRDESAAAADSSKLLDKRFPFLKTVRRSSGVLNRSY